MSITCTSESRLSRSTSSRERSLSCRSCSSFCARSCSMRCWRCMCSMLRARVTNSAWSTGLRRKSVGASLQGGQTEGAVVVGGDHHHRHVRAALEFAKPPGELRAVEGRHLVVGDDQVRHHARRPGQRLLRVTEAVHDDGVVDGLREPRIDMAVAGTIIEDGDQRHRRSRRDVPGGISQACPGGRLAPIQIEQVALPRCRSIQSDQFCV